MTRMLALDPEEITTPDRGSDRRLIAEILNRAVEDARSADAYAALPDRRRKLSHALTPRERDRQKRGFWNDECVLAVDAIHFLMTDRCHKYLRLLDIDPAVFREQLIQTQHRECTAPVEDYTEEGDIRSENSKRASAYRSARIASENKKRRIFRNNYKFYQERLRALSGGRNAR